MFGKKNFSYNLSELETNSKFNNNLKEFKIKSFGDYAQVNKDGEIKNFFSSDNSNFPETETILKFLEKKNEKSKFILNKNSQNCLTNLFENKIIDNDNKKSSEQDLFSKNNNQDSIKKTQTIVDTKPECDCPNKCVKCSTKYMGISDIDIQNSEDNEIINIDNNLIKKEKSDNSSNQNNINIISEECNQNQDNNDDNPISFRINDNINIMIENLKRENCCNLNFETCIIF